MRKKFVLFILVPLGLLCAVTYFFIDSWIESGLELAGEEIVGARVEIDGTRLTLFPLGIGFDRLQVASPDDPWTNLFETGKVRFRMDAGQLLRGKTIIETMEITDVILGTKRSTDGSIPGGKAPGAGAGMASTLIDEVLQRSAASAPLFDPALLRGSVNLDSLVKAQNFRTLALVDSLKGEVASASANWDSTVRTFEAGKKRFSEIEAQVKLINPSELKSVEKITGAITTVNDAQTTVKGMAASFTERQTAITGNLQKLAASVGTIDASVTGDVRSVLALARLPDLDATGLAEILLGRRILAHAQKGAHWIDMARTQAERYTPAPSYEKPPRFRGQDIHFPVERGYPRLWIKQILLSGGTDRTQDPEYVYLKGTVRNVSSDQRVTGEPMTVALDGNRGETVTLSCSALIDRRKAEPLDRYTLKMSGIPLAAVQIGRSDFLPSTITDGRLAFDVAVTVPGTGFDATSALRFRSLLLNFAGAPRNVGERLAREILSGVTGLDAGFRLWTREGGVAVAFTTDLDAQFAAGVKRVMGAELAKLQDQVRRRVEEEIAGRRKEFEQYYAAKRDEVQKQLNGYQSIVTEQTAMIDGKLKELETQLERQQKGAIDNLMKGIFKKN